MCPPANAITMSAAPIASGAMTPALAPIPVQPIVRTRKKVPMNSAIYLFISYLLTRHSLEKASRINNETLVLSRRDSAERAGGGHPTLNRDVMFASHLNEAERP